jgi:eukaryotic-like serine/threonine-protein kinase
LDTLIGSSIGGYILIKLLGAGGMGSVYLANDPAIGQQVAVKVIRTDLDSYTDTVSAQSALERFRQEARAVASLDHLHIVPLYRYGEEETPEGPRAYMIMQYRPEGSLWDWLRRRADQASGQSLATQDEFPAGLPTVWPLGLDEVADYLQQAASALQYAHDRGIVHRDIKPANFLLRIESHAKTRFAHLLLSDFGLAKVFTASSATNTILGTPTYMAPEQFEGAARPESDQYALAVMIYYLLAGRTPFEGDPMQLMHQHMMADVPSLTTFNPNVPPYMNGIFARAMAKRPEQRFPSISAFAEAFTRVIQPTSSAPQTLVVAQSAQVESARNFTTSAYSALTEMDNRPVSGPSGLPANNQAGRRSPNPLILPGQADPGQGQRMYNAASPAYPTPAPAPGAGNNPHAYAPPAYPSPSPVPGQGQGAYNATPGVPNYPTSASNPQGGIYNTPSNAFANPASVNGYASSGSGAGAGFAPSLAPGSYPPPPQQLGSNNRGGGQPVSRRSALGWILGTAAVVVVGSGIGGYFYLKNRLPANALFVLKGHSDQVTSLSWSPDSTKLLSGSLDATTRLWSSSDGSALQTMTASASVHAVAWSPDGNTLAAGTDDSTVTLWHADGSLLQSLTGWGANVRALAWRSDNNELFIGTYGKGLHAVEVSSYKHDGSDDLLHINALAAGPSGSSSGIYLAVGLADGSLYLADLTHNWRPVSTSLQPLHGATLALAWSPDGKSLGVGYANNEAVIYDSLAKTQIQLIHAQAVHGLVWHPTNANLLATACADNTVNFWDLSSSTTSPTAVYQGHSAAVLAVAWSPDGNYLASASSDQTIIIWQPPVSQG